MKVLYVMGIDWEWIFQRPQILAMHLEKNNDVTVIFPRSILRWNRKEGNQVHPKSCRILWTLPLQEKNRLIEHISRWWNRKVFRDVYSYDAVIIGYPLYYRYISKDYCGKVIYDCMDNHEALYPDRKRVARLAIQEKALAQRSDAIVATGEKLFQKMESLAFGKVRLIRNGTTKQICSEPCAASTDGTGKQVENSPSLIGYFGTLAEWFDYQLLTESLQAFPDIEYRLVGPVVKPPDMSSERLHMEGVVAHHRLPEVMRDCVCLVMPFVVNDVVEWVDPVKLYEYIALGKCIVCVYYEEVRRYADYVYFYRSHEEYRKLLVELKEKGFPPKYTSEKQKEFLEENSWDDRFRRWDRLLTEISD